VYNDFHLQVGQNNIKATYLRVDPNHEIKKTAKSANVRFDLKKYVELSIPIEEESLGDQKSYENQHKDIGKFLFSFLFSDVIDPFFHESLNQSIKEDLKDGLRLRLYVNDPKLSNVAWEFVYDDTEIKEYLCTLDTTPFTRFPHDIKHLHNMLLEQDNSKIVNQQTTVKALFISANAIGGKNTGGDRELKKIKKGLSRIKKNALVKIIPKEPELPTWQKVKDALEDNYNIVHFYGHGRFDLDEAKLIFETQDEGEDPIGPDTFRRLFISSKTKNLCFVFLNACEGAKSSEVDARSGLAQGLINSSLSYVSTVIAMQYAITIDPAAFIATNLYNEISSGNAIDNAVQKIRGSLLGSHEYRNKRFFATPVIFMRSTNGYVFSRLSPSIIIHSQLGQQGTIELNKEVSQIPQGVIKKMNVLVDSYDNKLPNREIGVTDIWKKEQFGGLGSLLTKLSRSAEDYGLVEPQKKLISSLNAKIQEELGKLDDIDKDDDEKGKSRKEITKLIGIFVNDFCSKYLKW
jgi:hypothetical protein